MEQLTFAKRPIVNEHKKRQSFISAILPEDASKRSNRTFSEVSNNIVDPQMPCDDPLLDYNEQIRVPKFRSAAMTDDIGSVIGEFHPRDLMEDDHANITHIETVDQPIENKSTYQPAKVELNRRFSTNDTTPSTSIGGNNAYTLDKFMKSENEEDHTKIRNLHIDSADLIAPSTRSTSVSSPLSSKKNSDESINYLASKKSPRFNMVPIRPIDDPKTPNYVPCVLRPTSSNISMLSSDMNSLLDNDTYDTSVNSEAAINFSKDHWKPNNSTSKCFDCEKQFSLINRRHHCRKCGEIFCASCLISQAKLNYQCNYDLNGSLAKVCFTCGGEWSNFLISSNLKDNTTLFPNFKQARKQQFDMIKEEVFDKTTDNVPADWTWSSF